MDCTISPGDTAFMVMASTFVMLQTPAMGVTQAGLIRRKNAVSMLMQTLTGLAIGSVLWMIIGFSLTFGPSQGGIIGNGIVFVFFQMMFALMVPVIVTGAWAEKMTYKAFLMFVTIWPFLVYYFLAHWVWNSEGWLFEKGVMDFAGGITIHTPAGVAASVVMTRLKKRSVQLGAERGSGHNIPLAILGASLIWAGWYSFNGGSALKANTQACAAVFNTHLSSCCSALVWSFAHRYMRKLQSGGKSLGHEWHATELCNGALAGLAAITPGSGFILPWAACLVGCLAGLAAFAADQARMKLELDDVCAVIALQGVPGALGSMLVGLLAHNSVGGITGVFYGGDWEVFGWQVCAVVVAVAWTAFWTFVLMIVIEKTVGIDVPPRAEVLGLDVWQTGDMAYDTTYDDEEETRSKLLHAACDAKYLQDARAALCSGLNPDWQDYDGRTALHVAASWGNLPMVRLLVKFGAAVDIMDATGGGALHNALHRGLRARNVGESRAAVAISKMLIAEGAELCLPNSPAADELKQDILIICGSGPQYGELLKVYADAGALRLAQGGDYDARCVTHLATFYGHIQLLQVLLANFDQLTLKDDTDDTGANENICSIIVANGHKRSLFLKQVDRWGHTAKYYAEHPAKGVQQKVSEDMCGLLSKFENGDAIPVPKLEPVSEPDAARVARVCSLAPELKLPWGWEDTHLAVSICAEMSRERGMMSAFKDLVNRGDAYSKYKLSEEQQVLRTVSFDKLYDYDGRTLLHVAVSKQIPEAVQFLVDKFGSATIDAVDTWGSTPLLEAVLQAERADALEEKKSSPAKANKIIKMLEGAQHGKPQPADMYPFGADRLAYHACSAAAKGQVERIKAYCRTFNISLVADYDGRTPLHLACCNGHTDVVVTLVEAATANGNLEETLAAKDAFGNTPKDDGTANNHGDCVAALVDGKMGVAVPSWVVPVEVPVVVPS